MLDPPGGWWTVGNQKWVAPRGGSVYRLGMQSRWHLPAGLEVPEAQVGEKAGVPMLRTGLTGQRRRLQGKARGPGWPQLGRLPESPREGQKAGLKKPRNLLICPSAHPSLHLLVYQGPITSRALCYLLGIPVNEVAKVPAFAGHRAWRERDRISK